ncbi:MAG: YihY/virulence factor BrkB family protein [Alistipes sp.]|nr:YihY/virulence factor BrkB family protein [Alistipes sp.]
MKLKEILTYFTDTIFRREASEWRSPVVRWFVQQYKLFFYTARGLVEHGTMIRSAALTFYTLMSLVPILAVVFAVVKGFGLADGLVQNLYALFPQSPEMIDYIVSFAEKALARTQGGVVATVALVMLFWAVIRVFGSIESAFNNIWEVKVQRSIARQWSDYIAIVMIVPVLWIIAGAVGGYARELLGFGGGWLYALLSRAMSVAVIWAMFTFLYLMIPNARVRFTSALMAGIVAGTAFALFQWGYLYVQRWMTSYNAIYGSFAALPLFLVWMQTSWQILLFGGELSFAYQNVVRFGEERESLRISYDQRRKILLSVMLTVVRHFRDEGGATPAETIRRRLELPTRIVNDVLYQLVQAGQLIAVPLGDDDRDMAFMPAHDLATLTLRGVLEAVERSGQGGFEPVPTPEFLRIDRELERLRQAGLAQENVRIVELLGNEELKMPFPFPDGSLVARSCKIH